MTTAFSDKEQTIRRCWLATFLALCGFDVFAFVAHTLPAMKVAPIYVPMIVAVFGLLLRALVFRAAYQKSGTRWLTFTLWSFWIGIGYAAIIWIGASVSNSYFLQMSLSSIQLGINQIGIPFWIAHQLVTCVYVYLTIRLRRINRTHRDSTLIVG